MINSIKCPGCGKQIENDGTRSGQTLACPECGHYLAEGRLGTATVGGMSKTIVGSGRTAFASATDFNKFCAVCSSVGCIAAGLYLLGISSKGGDTIMEAISHGIGIYCIAKGFFVGPMLIAQSSKN